MQNSQNNIESLLENKDSLLENYVKEDYEPLLQDSQFSLGEVPEAAYDEDISEDDKHFIDEHNTRVLHSPELQAQIVFDNYIRNNPRPMSGQEKRTLRRNILRLAKKGKYNYLFDEEKIRAKEERQRAKFEKLNKPVIHTADELSQDVKDKLLEMSEAEKVPEYNKETGQFAEETV